MAGLTDVLGPASMGLSAVGQIFSAFKGAKAAKESQALLNKQQQDNKSMYDNNANKDFLQTNAARDQVKEAKETLVDDQKQVAGRAAITGASDEATVAQNTRVSKNYADSLSRLAGIGTNYQQNQEAMYRSSKANLDNQQMGINQQKADNAANLAENAGNLMGTAAMGIKDTRSNPYKGDPGTVGKTGNFAPMKTKGLGLDMTLKR